LELEPSIPTGHDLYKVFDELRQDFKTINANSPDMVKLSCIHIKLCELKKKLIPAIKYITEIVEVEKYRDCGDLEQQNANLLQIIDNLQRDLAEFKNEIEEFKIIKSDDDKTIAELNSEIDKLTEQIEKLIQESNLLNTNKLDVEQTNDSIRGKLVAIARRKKELQKQFDTLKKENTELTQENRSLKTELLDALAEIRKLNQAAEDKLAEITELNETHKSNVDKNRSLIAFLINKRKQLTKEVSDNKILNERLTNKIAMLEIKINTKDAENAQLVSTLNSELNYNTDAVAKLELKLLELNKTIIKLNT
jgi:chromosome segregation ATPase